MYIHCVCMSIFAHSADTITPCVLCVCPPIQIYAMEKEAILCSDPVTTNSKDMVRQNFSILDLCTLVCT